MMPSSYRQPDDREGDRIVYFDYAKSLESRKRPIPWKLLRRLCLAVLCRTALVTGLVLALGGPLTAGRFLVPLVGLVCVVGIIPIIRANRALSAENFSEVKRGRRDGG